MKKTVEPAPLIRDFFLPVGAGHEIHVEEAGNPNGTPVIFLHGGPGGHIEPICRTFFDPDKYRVILFDQRGCGKSRPFLSVEDNTPFESVKDMEAIRTELGIESWLVFGGSYGSTLALTYAITHPDRVRHLVLRGIFLGRKWDIDWLYRGGAGTFFPDQYRTFASFVEEGQDPIIGYHQALTGEDQARRDEACRRWAKWEDSLVNVQPDFPDPKSLTDGERSIAVMENHYFFHQTFFPSDNYLLDASPMYRDIPMDIVQGRYDMICPPTGAIDLARHCPKARLHLVEGGGHNPYEEAMFRELRGVMDQI